jgi:glucosamine-6-phosphate deaminase
MNVRVYPTEQEAARAAAATVTKQLKDQPASVLGLPTGRTSLGIYDELARLHINGRVDFARAHTFIVDEFVGVSSKDRQSFCAFMEKHLFGRINLPKDHIHFLNGKAEDPAAECDRFEQEIAACGGIDLLLLGIGANGHIGFNEPARGLVAQTHVTRLTPATRRANASLFGNRQSAVPVQALSMGMATILRARRIVLLATGAAKAGCVQQMIEGRVTPRVPASFLQLHRCAEVWIDRAAAARLKPSRSTVGVTGPRHVSRASDPAGARRL